MSNIGHGLVIKYGLQHRPSSTEIDRWREKAQRQIDLGHAPEAAGLAAAKAVFGDYNTVVYASEADTITTLLRAASEK